MMKLSIDALRMISVVLEVKNYLIFVSMLNGRVLGDSLGSYTCHKHNCTFIQPKEGKS